MSNLDFVKMHGLGNDFMVLDLVTQEWDPDPDHIRRWADRKTGIGFDQLLVLAPPTDPDADFWYRIYNADGSEAEQCGNGARCIARFAHQNQLSPKPRLRLQTTSGMLQTTLEEGSYVAVEFAAPSFDHERVPFDARGLGENDGSYRLCANSTTFAVTPVSIGNPHGIIFVSDVTAVRVAEVGPALTGHRAFPQQANIGFCQVIDGGFVRLRVHERGVGETRACGSGACAAVAVARRAGQVNERVKVSLPGGKLKVYWGGEGEPITLSGPTSRVFDGQVSI